MRHGAPAAATLCLLLLAPAAPLHAEELVPVDADRQRVAIITPNVTHPRVNRLRAELQALGFITVVALRPERAPTRGQVRRMARDTDVVAAIDLDDDRTIVWVIVPHTGRLLRRKVVHTGPDPDPAAVAVAAGELVRAALIESTDPVLLPEPGRGGATDAEEPANLVRRPPAPSTHHLSLALGATATFSPGGFDPGGHVQLLLGWGWVRWFQLELQVTAPVVPAQVRSQQSGVTRLYSGMAGGGARLLYRPTRQLTLSSALGLSATLVRVDSEGTSATQPGTTGIDVWKVAATPYSDLRLHVCMTRYLTLQLHATLGLVLTRFDLGIEGLGVKSWGQPLIGLGAGLALEL